MGSEVNFFTFFVIGRMDLISFFYSNLENLNQDIYCVLENRKKGKKVNF